MLINKLVKQVERLNLNLKGKTVLTEAASGAYIVTPVIAALAGAKVFAFSKTTRYGKTEDIFSATRELSRQFKKFPLDIQYAETLSAEIVAQVDLITNSGHLRPLNESLLRNAKDSMVIALMYEAWEWRDEDMDVNYIRKRRFPIGATNERHPDVDVFNYLGDMALKQIFDAGICPYKNKFVLLCNNDFGPYIAKVLAKNCEGLAVIDDDEHQDRYNTDEIDWIGGFPNLNIPPAYKDAEAILFTAYPFNEKWIGLDSPIRIEQLQSQFTDPFILRYAGDLDETTVQSSGLRFFPSKVQSGHMGILPSAIGFDPIIRLQAGGLKAGEAMLTGQYEYRNLKIVDIL